MSGIAEIQLHFQLFLQVVPGGNYKRLFLNVNTPSSQASWSHFTIHQMQKTMIYSIDIIHNTYRLKVLLQNP